jgi:hypothetical protein
MNRYYFYVLWDPGEPPFWWDMESDSDFAPQNFYINSTSFQVALSQISFLPGKVAKILSYHNLDGFTEEELHNQGYYNLNLYTTI